MVLVASLASPHQANRSCRAECPGWYRRSPARRPHWRRAQPTGFRQTRLSRRGVLAPVIVLVDASVALSCGLHEGASCPTGFQFTGLRQGRLCVSGHSLHAAEKRALRCIAGRVPDCDFRRGAINALTRSGLGRNSNLRRGGHRQSKRGRNVGQETVLASG